jgi:hypothetical protein
MARGRILEQDADEQLDAINAEEGRLLAQLSALETNRRLAEAYMRRIREAEATLRDLRSRTNLNSPEDRRQVI